MRLSTIIREFRNSRIQTRLIFLVLLTTLPLLIGLTAYITYRAQSQIEVSADNDLAQTNDVLSTNVSTWLDLNIRSLQEMTIFPDIVGMDAGEQTPILQAMSQSHPYMYLVSTTNLSGLNIARNDGAEAKDYSDRIWFQNARDGAEVTYQTLIGKTSGMPALVISMPIRRTSGQIVGVGMFAAELTNLSEETSVSVIGETGYTFIVDADDMVLAHPDPAFTAGELVDFSEYPPVVALRQGQTGLINFTDDNGVRWRAYATLLDNGWGIITQQQEAEILAPVRRFQGVAITLIVLGVAALLLLSWLTIRRTLQPIATLTNTVSAIAGGDLNRVVDVRSKDEIGVLAATFNNMTSQLRGMIGSLENRVQERTHDLELASEVGRTITGKVANLEEMLTEAVELIRARFNLYYTQIYLIDPNGHTLVLRAGTGEVGKQLLQRGHRLPVGPGSLNGRTVEGKSPIIVEDAAQDASFLPNPLLPKTRSEMCVPLIVGGQVIGVLDMQSEVPGSLNETNLPAFQTLAGQFSIAIQNASLLNESQEARKDMEASVRRFTREGWQEFLNGIDRQEQIGYIYDQGKTSPIMEGQQTPLPNALVMPLKVTGETIGTIQTTANEQGWTSQESEIVSATAAQLSQHIEGLRLLAQAEHFRAEAERAVQRLTREGWEVYRQARSEISRGFRYDLKSVNPVDGSMKVLPGQATRKNLTVRDESIGELVVDAGSLSDETQDVLNAVASQLSGHLENLRLSEQNERRAYDLATVAEVSTSASKMLNPDELLQSVVDLTKSRFNLYHTHIYLLYDPWNTLALSVGAGEVGRLMVEEKHSIPLDAEKSLVARAARERKAVIVNDVRKEADFLANPHLPNTRSEIAVPMIVGDQVLGVFDIQSEIANNFTEEDANIYTTLAAQVGVTLQNARLYAAQTATVAQLRELDRLKSSFLANMSHELRTPLNSILGFADVMLDELDGPLTENMNSDLQLIQKNGQHLLNLINDVLDMAKIEAGRMNLVVEKFMLHDILEEITSIASPLANEKNIDLLFDPDSDRTVEITADRTRLRQVMLNLVNNSIKFTEQGFVSIRTERQNDQVFISVKDTGIGISPDHLESIFQEFVQVDTSSTRKAGGTGLGLPISRKLIELHGGRLWAESSGVNGAGSTLKVLLPVVAQPDKEMLEGEKANG